LEVLYKMGWEGSAIRISLNKDARDLIEEKRNHLEENYEGPSHFFRQKLEEEEVLSVDEKIKQIRTQKQELENKLSKYQQIKNERSKQQLLNQKKQELKTLQESLKQVRMNELPTESDIRQEETEKRKERGYDVSDSKVQEAIERRVRKRLENQPDVKELRSRISQLQSEVAELNGGREDWFMDLSQQETEVEA